ncbi:MAG: hypothetical protein LVQ63_07410 [Thermoplasmatales archaeon]|nr:hypothetical protein [Thermoplasmatales archaeon]
MSYTSGHREPKFVCNILPVVFKILWDSGGDTRETSTSVPLPTPGTAQSKDSYTIFISMLTPRITEVDITFAIVIAYNPAWFF